MIKNPTRENILEYLSSKKEIFRQKYHLKTIGLFGSYARNEARENSDIDLLYKLEKGYKMSFDNYLQFEKDIKNMFNKNIDIVNAEKINPLVLMQAEKEVIYV